jgi:hypothetical protein
MLRGRPIMKRFVAAMACGAVIAGAYSLDTQAQAPKAAPAALPPAAAAPAPVAPAPAAAPPAASAPAPKAPRHAKKQTWTRADARVCLEFPTNAQIIRCAEKYRYARAPT